MDGAAAVASRAVRSPARRGGGGAKIPGALNSPTPLAKMHLIFKLWSGLVMFVLEAIACNLVLVKPAHGPLLPVFSFPPPRPLHLGLG